MTVSPLADLTRDIPALDRWSRRESPITGFGIHHNAGVDAYDQATAKGREVSANYWITNAGVILPNVDEDYRAFTSGMAGYPAGAAADHRNITVEVSNSPEGVRSGSWAISDRAEAALAALIGDVYRRYGLGPVRRGADRGVGLHRDWVPTECPGPYIVGNIDRIIHSAELARVGGASPVTVLGEDMYHFIVQNKHQFTVSDGKLHHLGTTGQADIVPRVIGKTHKITKAEFDEFLQAADVPLDVYRWSDGAVLDPQTGQFMRNGTWSRARQLLGVQGVQDYRGKK